MDMWNHLQYVRADTQAEIRVLEMAFDPFRRNWKLLGGV